MARTGARTGRVSRVAGDGRVYVELADVAPGFEFGPVLDTVGGLAVGERVIVTALARDEDELVIIGRLDVGVAPLAHTHHADDVNDGVLALNRLPVAPSGNANPTQIVRADDARLDPTQHNHDSRYYTEAEVNALLDMPKQTVHVTPQQVIPEATVTKVVNWLYNANASHANWGYNAGDFTIPSSGWYRIKYSFLLVPNASANKINSYIYAGSTVLAQDELKQAASEWETVQGEFEGNLAAGDLINIRLYAQLGTTVYAGPTYGRLIMRKVSATH